MSPLQLGPDLGLARDKFAGHFFGRAIQAYHDTSSRPPPTSSISASIRSIAWNPVSTLVATAGASGHIRVWNPDKPSVRFSTELKGHSGAVARLAFNPTRDAELASAGEDGTARVWDVRTKACVAEARGLGTLAALAWTPDGQEILVANTAGTLWRLSPRHAAGQTPLAEHALTFRTPGQLAFCWGGKHVYVPGEDGAVRVLAYPSFEPALRLPYRVPEGDEFVLRAHTAACSTVEPSPTGRYLATGGDDSVMALFDTKDWICQRTVARIPGPVRNISFTCDGSYVVAACNQSSGYGLDVTHVETGDHVHTFKTAGSCNVAAWAPTKYYLAYADLGVLRIVGLPTEAEKR